MELETEKTHCCQEAHYNQHCDLPTASCGEKHGNTLQTGMKRQKQGSPAPFPSPRLPVPPVGDQATLPWLVLTPQLQCKGRKSRKAVIFLKDAFGIGVSNSPLCAGEHRLPDCPRETGSTVQSSSATTAKTKEISP